MENKKANKPFITVKEAIVSALVIALVAIAFEKPFPIEGIHTIPLRKVSENEVHQFATQIEQISAEKIKEKLGNGKPTFLFMYASWCSYCKKLMTNITSLKNEGKINEINFLPISVDKQKTKLSHYLLQRDYNKLFTPYIIDNNTEKELENIVAEKGGNYSPSIPYSIIFDANGNAVEEINGTIDKEILLEKLNYAKNHTSKKILQ
ncbi:MAG: thioredoxin fold domain-containing protein [Pseudomonadota bacterium]